eukprot:gene6548-3199_t
MSLIASRTNVASLRGSMMRPMAKSAAKRVVPRAATDTAETVSGVIFEPMSAVKAELATVDKTDMISTSFARVDFNPACEAAINEQIKVSKCPRFNRDRDNVGLPGLVKFFKEGADEERDHNKRGGRVKLGSLMEPETEFYHEEKGDALYAMELALSLEKLNFQKLRELQAVADKCEGELLKDQVDSVKQVSEFVSQLRRVGKGLGVYQFDKELA